ncbi:MAG: DsbA family protein [Chloroflexi bacterium]|nr:DsbA family protein [Chloroflexota bacterium]
MAAKKRNKRAQIREQRLARQRRERIIVMVVIAGIILMVGGLLVLSSAPSPQATSAPNAPTDIIPITPVPRPNVNMNAAGDPNAPVTIIEYSDFQCPYCGRFAREVEPLIVKNYVDTGKVRFIYRTFGDWIGPESLLSAEAAYCAGDQGKFWEFHDILFANQHGENQGAFTRERIEAMAKLLGLNMDEFRQCLDSHKYQKQAMQDLADGQAAGVQGTPSFIIIAPDGSQELVVGALPYDQFKEHIDAALAKQSK